MRAIAFLLLVFANANLIAQSTAQNLTKAWDIFIKDTQMKYAIASLTVVDATTGKTIFERNGNIGLAPASTQKIITSVAAYELLGKNYRYKTLFGFSGQKQNDSLAGVLFVRGSGDPSLGSDRFLGTKPGFIINKWVKAVSASGIRKLSNEFFVDQQDFDPMPLPGGWIVEDIGNYYGAGAYGFNWRENQYDLRLKSGKEIGDPVEVVAVNGNKDFYFSFNNQLKSAAKGSGDNAIIYLPVEGSTYYLKGTIPVNESAFEISGAIANPADYFIDSFRLNLQQLSLLQKPDVLQYSLVAGLSGPETVLDSHFSPPLDSLNYWFLRKSINLYGEAFVKTIARERKGFGSTELGIKEIKDFYKKIGIEEDAISIIDGSGLSPQSRVTTGSMTKILQFARSRPWFSSFLYSLPEFNGMKMKSGYIGGVRAFSGYHQSKAGVIYTYSIMVNNFRGSSAEITKKIYKLLDYLK